MTANTVNGSRNGARSGAQILVLLSSPLNVQILRALAESPKQQAELRRATGLPAQTTLRAQLKKLVAIGAIDKHRRNSFPGVLRYELAGPGGELLSVASTLEGWLGQAAEGPLPLDSNAAKAATKALTEGWSSTMVRALAGSPLSLTELDGVIGSHSYPALERRLAAMRLAGLVVGQPSNGRGRPYEVTDWLRRGVAPLAGASRWERRHLPRQTAPIGRLDVEAAFLLTVPLLEPPTKLSGACRMAVEISNGDDRRLAGVTVEVERGRIATCATQLQAGAESWALGSPAAWLNAVIERDAERLELGGDRRLATILLGALHEALFGHSASRTTVEP